MKKTLSILLVLAIVCVSAAQAEKVDRSYNERFDVEEGARLELRHGDGEVIITPWDEKVIEVDVTYRADFTRVGVGKDPDFECTFDQTGDVVRVTGHESSHGGIGFFAMNETEFLYRVRAPRWVVLDLEGDDGDVDIESWEAAISLQGDDGDINLVGIRGDVTIKVEDGDVELEDIEGAIDVRSDDGDVDIRDCVAPRVRVDVEDGDVQVDRCEGDFEVFSDDGDLELSRLRTTKVELGTQDGRIDLGIDAAVEPLDVSLETNDGSIEIAVADGISARFDLYSSGGRVSVNAPDAKDVSEDRRRTSGQLGGGEGKIRASTSDGRITLRQ